jgi:hypothetical protein
LPADAVLDWMEENLPPLDGSAILEPAPPREEPLRQHTTPPRTQALSDNSKTFLQRRKNLSLRRKNLSLGRKTAKKPAKAAAAAAPAEPTAKCYELSNTLMSLVDVLGSVEGGEALTELTRTSTGAAAEGEDIYDMIDAEVHTRGLDRSRDHSEEHSTGSRVYDPGLWIINIQD